MKLGLYGGGFKPFTTGHFAKLADAIRDNDKVILFYGIQQEEPPEFYKRANKKKGIRAGDKRPPRQAFRKIGDTGRVYDESVGSKIFKVYERAFERIPEIEIIPVYSQDIDKDFGKKMTPLNQIFKVLDSFASNPDLYEKVSIYGDRESLPRFINYPPIQALRDSGRVQLGGATPVSPADYEGEAFEALMAAGEKEAQSALRDYYLKMDQDVSDEDLSGRQSVRGTDVRMYASTEEGVEDAMTFLPPFLTQDEKMEIIKILQGEAEKEIGAIQETSILPIITDQTIMRAAVRFIAESPRSASPIKEAKRKKGEDHILGLTEEIDLTFDELKQIIDDVLSGRIDHIEEKMDGQNFTFTILDDGDIRLFGKGVSATTLEKPGPDGRSGLNLGGIKDHPRWSESVKDAFGSAYGVLEKYIQDQEFDSISRLFRNGQVVVEGQIMTPINPNTIPYTENHLRFVRPFTPYDIEIDQDTYDDFFADVEMEALDSNDRAWSLGAVPKLEQTEADASEMRQKISELQDELDRLVSGFNPPPETIGEYAAQALSEYVESKVSSLDLSSLSPDQRSRALRRLATGDKKLISAKELAPIWKDFQGFEKSASMHIQGAIVELEKIVQKLGSYFFDTVEFTLATNSDTVSSLAAEVEKIKNKVASDQIAIKDIESGDVSEIIDTAWATRLDNAISRVENMDLFKKPTEGVVLRVPGPDGTEVVRKITGMFTPIHRLVAMFKYPDRTGQVLTFKEEDISNNPLNFTDEEVESLNEALRKIVKTLKEGGNAFKDAEGNIVTSPEKIPRDVANRVLADLKSNLLDPLGLVFEPVGSTDDSREGRPDSWRPSEMIGDIDILVDIPDELVASTESQRQEYRDPNASGISKNDKRRRSARQRKIERGQGSETPRKDALYISLRGHPYLADELVPGVARVIDSADGSRILVQDRVTGKLYQVDVDLKRPDRSFDDERWERSGGGQGTAKGLYRNLLLSFIAKLKSQKESEETGKIVKITFALGKGLRKQVEGEDDVLTIDPDEYLPILGIEADKNSVRSFEQLVDYMVQNPSDIFTKALTVSPPGTAPESGSFDQYVGRPAMSDQNEVAFDYIRRSLSEGSQTVSEMAQRLSEMRVRRIIQSILSESDSSDSGIEFIKVNWNDSLKMFPGVYENRDSASATGGKDEEGAEKAVAISENLIHLHRLGYRVSDVGDGVLVQGKEVNVKLDKQEGLNYLLGYETDAVLPAVKIAHVPGLEKYDLLLIEGSRPMEVKKMGSRTVLSKLGSATSRDFERNVPLLKPLRSAANTAKKFIEAGLIDEDGSAIVKTMQGAPSSFKLKEIGDAVEILNDLFFRVQYGTSSKELQGIKVKLDSGQLPAGMIAVIRGGKLLSVGDRDALELCKTALDASLGEYSPTNVPSKEDDTEGESDFVDISAKAGDNKYDGKVSLDYFFNDLIFRLYDGEEDADQIDRDQLKIYTDSIEFLASIYPFLVEISDLQGPDSFNQFIDDLHYAGFYGVTSELYYSVACTPDRLSLYSTTQGFRALLRIDELPSQIVEIPTVDNPKKEEPTEIDLDPVEIEAGEESDESEELEVT